MFPQSYLFDYDAMCNQPVTVYSHAKEGVTRTLYPKAYHEETLTQEQGARGEGAKVEHLVVIPGEAPCKPGDKLFLGVGEEPQGDHDRWWREFIPSKVEGVVVARSVARRAWLGDACHVEVRG